MAIITLDGPLTGPRSLPSHQRLGWTRLTRMVALTVAGLIGSRFILTQLFAIGFPIAFALTPVWWPVVRTSRWARTSMLIGVAAGFNGVVLAALNSGHRRVDTVIGAHLVVELLGVLASAAAMVWVIRTVGLGPAGIAYAAGMLLNARPDAASNASDPLRFAYGTPLVLLLIALAATTHRAWVQVASLLVGTAFSLFMGSRSVFGVLVMALLIILMWYRPVGRSIKPPRMATALALAGGAAGIVAVGQRLLLEGLFGSGALARTQQQLASAGNLLLGGRPEIGATWALMRDRIWGYGTGILPSFHDVQVARTGMASIGYNPFNGYVDHYMFGETFRLHSILGDVWAVFGVIGVVFVIHLLVQAIGCVHMGPRPNGGDALMLTTAAMTVWNALFSPWYASVQIVVLFLATAWTRQLADATAAAHQQPTRNQGDTMDLRSYLELLRRSLAVIIVTTVVGVVGGLGIALAGATSQRADVAFYVTTPFTDGRDAMPADQFAQSRVATYLDLIKTDAFAKRVTEASGTTLTQDQVAASISAQSEIGTVVITATVTQDDSSSALAIAQAVEVVFPEFVNELENGADQTGFVTVDVVSPASEQAPQGRDPLRWAILGGVIGLVAGVMIAFVMDATNTRLRTLADLEEVTMAPVLAELDERGDITTAARQVRALLCQSQMVLIASEGASPTATVLAHNLAQAYTDAGLDTALVNPVGVTSVSTGSRGFTTSDGSTPDVPEIVLLPDFAKHGVTHKEITDLVTRMRARHERIVVDGAALDLDADGLALAALCDETVVVVDPDTSDRGGLARTVQRLNMVGGRLRGTVLVGHLGN